MGSYYSRSHQSFNQSLEQPKEEYFVWEEKQLEKHELIDGQVYASTSIEMDLYHKNAAGDWLIWWGLFILGLLCRKMSKRRKKMTNGNKQEND